GCGGRWDPPSRRRCHSDNPLRLSTPSISAGTSAASRVAQTSLPRAARPRARRPPRGLKAGVITMLATLAERELTGATASAGSRCRSPRSRSDRDWAKGDPNTPIVLGWGKQQQRQASSGRKPKLLRLLCRVLAKLAADKGFRFQPEPNGPTVQAVYGKELLAAFAEHYHVTGDAKQKRQKRWVATT